MNSFTFNSKKLPWALILALAIILLFEVAFFSKAYLASSGGEAVLYEKKTIIENGPGADVAIFGDSPALSIDASSLEEYLLEGKVYNYALINLRPPWQFYRVLEKYLKTNKPPELIILSTAPFHFYHEFSPEYEMYGFPMNRYRRFFRFGEVFGAVISRSVGWQGFGAETGAEKYKGIKRSIVKALYGLGVTGEVFLGIRHAIFNLKSIAAVYLDNMFHSLDYRYYLRDNLLPYLSTREETSYDKSLKETIETNKRGLDYMRKHNGQVYVFPDEIIPEEELNERMPAEGVDYKKEREVPGKKHIEKFIELAEKNNIPVVFVFTPIWDKKLDRMEEVGVFQNIEGVLNEWEDKYDNFSYYEENDISYDRNYIADWTHLNRNGYIRFNEDFRRHFNDILEEKGFLLDEEEEKEDLAPDDSREVIVFFGDSITYHANWLKLAPADHFSGSYPIILNFAVKGADIDYVSGKIDSVIHVEPDKVFVMVGTNDIDKDMDFDAITKRYSNLIKKIKERFPESEIFIQSILPRSGKFYFDGMEEYILKLNRKIEGVSAQYGCAYIDIFDYFSDSDKKMLDGYTWDGVHLNSKGKALWLEKIKPYLKSNLERK